VGTAEVSERPRDIEHDGGAVVWREQSRIEAVVPRSGMWPTGSSFVHVIESPTLIVMGSGSYLKLLIVTLTVAESSDEQAANMRSMVVGDARDAARRSCVRFIWFGETVAMSDQPPTPISANSYPNYCRWSRR
jgi:hypothetical protein